MNRHSELERLGGAIQGLELQTIDDRPLPASSARSSRTARNVIAAPIGPHSRDAEQLQPEMDAIPFPTPASHLTLRQRVWSTIDDPTSSTPALLIALLIVGSIVTSIVAFILQSLPWYVAEDRSREAVGLPPDNPFTIIEDVCITIFTIEFALRVYSTPSFRTFITTPLNLIDLLAILPFYVELVAGGTGGGTAAILRIIRLIRIFRIFKVARYLPWLRVFAAALSSSVQPLVMLVFVVLIGVIIFASCIYYAERGEWSDAAGTYVRVVDGEASPSPYSSIPASMWWAIITMTTVGYGDMYPITGVGKLIASLAALSGILVIAIPITIISTNFNAEYGSMNKEKERVKARMALLRAHFAAKRAGLDAVLDEVADMVRRNTQEFQDEVHTLFDAAREEMTEEIQEIVRMAFERRRQLHLAALTAGRVQGASADSPQRGASRDEEELEGLHARMHAAAAAAASSSSATGRGRAVDAQGELKGYYGGHDREEGVR